MWTSEAQRKCWNCVSEKCSQIISCLLTAVSLNNYANPGDRLGNQGFDAFLRTVQMLITAAGKRMSANGLQHANANKPDDGLQCAQPDGVTQWKKSQPERKLIIEIKLGMWSSLFVLGNCIKRGKSSAVTSWIDDIYPRCLIYKCRSCNHVILAA